MRGNIDMSTMDSHSMSKTELRDAKANYTHFKEDVAASEEEETAVPPYTLPLRERVYEHLSHSRNGGPAGGGSHPT